MSHFLFLGPPASGKGTQAKRLSQQYGWPHISTGDIFRQAYQQETKSGILAHDQYWGKGNLVPDEITNTLAFDRLQQQDCKEGYILDGYPRTMGQAVALKQFLRARTGLDAALYFSCPESFLIERVASRRICRDCGAIYGKDLPSRQEEWCDFCPGAVYQRPDDQEEIMKERLMEYQRKTASLFDFYLEQGILREIDAALPAEQVFRQLQKIIENK